MFAKFILILTYNLLVLQNVLNTYYNHNYSQIIIYFALQSMYVTCRDN